MRHEIEPVHAEQSDVFLLLDCTSIGRLVRRRTFEAVEMHFGMLADGSEKVISPGGMRYEVEWSEP